MDLIVTIFASPPAFILTASNITIFCYQLHGSLHT